MASFTVEGLPELKEMFDNIANIPTGVMEDMLNAQADIVVRAQQGTARSMLQGLYYQGMVASGVVKRRPQATGNGGHQYISFDGTQHGNRIAEIAFVNEFGKTGQAARPFIETANEKSAQETTEAAQSVYDNWIDKL